MEEDGEAEREREGRNKIRTAEKVPAVASPYLLPRRFTAPGSSRLARFPDSTELAQRPRE